jgi:urease accessory protein
MVEPATAPGGAALLLTALQYGDGQFPGGGFAFSWGLESMVAEGRLARAGFGAYLAGQLAHRWARCDRVLVAHAHSAAQDDTAWSDLDALAEALATVEAARTGSRRAGLALLGTHVRLGTPGAGALRAMVDRADAHGHLPVVQGVVLAGTGLTLAATLAVSGYTAASALATAGIRLGLIGHLDAQRALQQVRPLLASLADAAVPALDDICTLVPESDLAMMRHADLPRRLFSN